MKRILIVLSLLMAMAASSYALGITGRVGFAGGGEFDKDIGGQDFEIDGQTLDISLEVTQNLIFAKVGAGINYMPGFDLKPSGEMKSVTTPYALAKLSLPLLVAKPSLVVKAGVPQMSDDNIEGKLYAAVGVGLEVIAIPLDFELLYNTYTMDRDGVGDRTLTRISLNVGYQFFGFIE